MISPVFNLSFKGDVQASDWQKLIESDGQYTQKPADNAKPDRVELSTDANQKDKKGGKVGKTLGSIVGGVIVAGLALYGLTKGNILKVDKDAKGLAKIGSYLAEVGDWIGTKMIDPLLGLFKGKKAADTAKDATDTAQGLIA